MPFTRDPQRARFNDVFVIQSQRNHSRSTGRRKPNNVRPAIGPGEMLAPQLGTRIEKWDKVTCQWIESMRFHAFILIAAIAGRTKVLQVVTAAQYTRKNVVNNQRHPNHTPRGLAILASFVRALSYLTRQRG